jgi:hypothetical protein
VKYLARAGNTKTAKDCGVQVPTRALILKKVLKNTWQPNLNGLYYICSTKGEIMNITQNFTVYTGTFTNKSGFQRKMRFVKLSDFPSSVTSGFKSRNLQPGYETVWDLDLNQFRTFNYNTQVGILGSTNSVVTIKS